MHIASCTTSLDLLKLAHVGGLICNAKHINGINSCGLCVSLIRQNGNGERNDLLELDETQSEKLASTSILTTSNMLFGELGLLICWIGSCVVKAKSWSVGEDLDLLGSVCEMRGQRAEEDAGELDLALELNQLNMVVTKEHR